MVHSAWASRSGFSQQGDGKGTASMRVGQGSVSMGLGQDPIVRTRQVGWVSLKLPVHCVHCAVCMYWGTVSMNLYQIVRFRSIWVEQKFLSVRRTQIHGLCAKSARVQSGFIFLASARSIRVRSGLTLPLQGPSEFSQDSIGLCKVDQCSVRTH
jgi:hypothetical protein